MSRFIPPSLFLCWNTAHAHGSNSNKEGPLVSINTEYRYPFPWETVTEFVLSEKSKGPPDNAITLKRNGMTFSYAISMPWYARLLLGREVLWDDKIHIDTAAKSMIEIGQNTNLTHLGLVTDTSSWDFCPDDPQSTLYKKRVDFHVKAPWSADVIMKVSSPLINWFHAKSKLMREIEVAAITAAIAENL